MMTTSKSALEALKKAAMDPSNESCKEFAQAMEAAVNPFGFDHEEFVGQVNGDASSKKFFMDICYAWLRIIEYTSKERFRYDDRNKYAVETGASLMNDQKLQGHVHDRFPVSDKWIERNIRTREYKRARDMGQDEDPAMYVATLISGTHRTLFQTFSRQVFLFLNFENALFGAQKSLYEGWWKCPQY